MYEQQSQVPLLYMMLYGAAAMLSMTACGYLLLRRANAIAPDVTSPVRLRRWTAAFFASMSLSHLWYLPIAFLTSSEDIFLAYLVGALLDFLTLIPLSVSVLLVMLQDRRRPLWPVGVMVAPAIVGLTACIVNRNDAIIPFLYGYQLALGIVLLLYMVRATRQYGHWLRDNYADLEHKEVWQSLLVLAIILLVFGIYSFALKGPAYKYISQANNFLLVGFLLWRVETLSDLSHAHLQEFPEGDGADSHTEREHGKCPSTGDDGEHLSSDSFDNLTSSFQDRSASPHGFSQNIEPLLKQYCEESRLYLQYDISANTLAKKIGTNRVYLSRHFALQGTTYNAYINGLRIQHFINLYNEAVATHQPIVAKQLAYQSGFRSYSTFSAAFKQIMGMTVTEWMLNRAESTSI